MNAEITFPVSSILINTQSIVNACEDLELSASLPSAPTPTPASTSTSTSTDAAPSAEPQTQQQQLPLIILTELAALIHLQEYDHARHLWRRYASQQHDESYCQFVLLWRALRPLLLAHSQDHGSTSSSSSSSIPKDDNPNGDMSSVSVGGGSTTALVEVYDSLREVCGGGNPIMEPLASYAQQLQSSIRAKVAQSIERMYESMDHEKCMALLGFRDDDDDGELKAYLHKRKWTREVDTGLWIPSYQPQPVQNGNGNDGGDGGGDVNRIDYLANLVGFMEMQRVNA